MALPKAGPTEAEMEAFVESVLAEIEECRLSPRQEAFYDAVVALPAEKPVIARTSAGWAR